MSVTANGHTYAESDMRHGGYRTLLIPMLADVMVENAASVAAAAAAAVSAASAASAAAGWLSSTTTDSLSLSAGTKNLTVETGKQFVGSSPALLMRTADPGGTYLYGTITSYTSGTGAVVFEAAGAVGTGGPFSDWTLVLSGVRGADGPIGGMARRAITGADTALATDKGALLDITAATSTLAFQPAATLGAGWYAFTRNAGSGDITLDPSGAETIDGLASYISYPGEVRLILVDGGALHSIVLQGFRRSWLSSGTFTKPPGYQDFGGRLWGAGGSAGKGGATNDGTGGGGGACHEFVIAAALIAASESVDIGAGATGPSTADTDGADGGDSTFGPIVAQAGKGGVGTSDTAGGEGGSVGALSLPGFVNRNTASGGQGTTCSSSYGVPSTEYGGSPGGCENHTTGGNAVYGGAGGGCGLNDRPGGTSEHGGDGGDGASTTSGGDGVQPGGGGGGTQTGTKAGDGADGQLDLWGIV